MNTLDLPVEELEAIVLEFTQRLRRGEPASVEEYALRFPQHGATIRELFPTIQSMEALKRRRQAPADAGNNTPADRLHGDTPLSVPPAATDLARLFQPAQAPDEIGRLGSYRILTLLGRGGMGAVFVAEDLRLHRTVALKVMLPDLAATAEAHERFLREARTAATLEDDHIVTIYQADEDRGVKYIAMPLLKGSSLEDRLQAGPPLTVAPILRIGREVAEGLAAAHEHGLIHRDVKPSNVWLESRPGETSSFRVKVLDFGLARHASGDAHLTQSHVAVGTPLYMAPEQARGETIDGRADLFSLGVVLYRLCTGRFPFQGAGTMQVLMALASHVPPPPHTVNGGVPPALSALVMQLLEKESDRRPPSARAVVSRLLEMEAALPTSSPAETPTVVPALPSPRRRRRLPWVVAGVAAFALVSLLLGFAMLRIDGPDGTLFVKINDDGLVISVTNEARAVVYDKSTQRTFSFRPHKGEVHVYDKDGKQLLATRQFNVRKGEQTTLEVTASDIKAVRDKVLEKARGPRGAGAWRPLFNGKDLTGWKLHPALPGDWSVVNGVLVGKGRGSLLFSESGEIGDFRLRVEARINAVGDSGIFFWTSFILDPTGLPTAWHEVNIKCSGSGTGGLCGQDRSTRGAVVPPPDQWFEMEVVAAGNHVTCQVNGKNRSELRFPAAKKGHVALQVYANSKVNTIVQFRKIEIKEPAPSTSVGPPTRGGS